MVSLKYAVVALFVLAAPPSWSNSPQLRFGIERFEWREYDDDGSRLLVESGPRFVIGIDWEEPQTSLDALLQLRGELYIGQVDYDGQACTLSGTCTPFGTDTNYVGARGEALLARRYGAVSGPELFGGAGVDTWRRDIRGHSSVNGVIEDWWVFYITGGAGYLSRIDGGQFNLRAGVKFPFYVYEVPNSYDLTLNPKGAASLFARADFRVQRNAASEWGFGVYYDSYRFDKSSQRRSGSVVVWQPESQQDTLGIYGALYF